MNVAQHYSTSEIRLNQAIGHAFWLIDAQWPKEASHALTAANAFWTSCVDAIRADTECEAEAKITRLHLLIADIKRERI